MLILSIHFLENLYSSKKSLIINLNCSFIKNKKKKIQSTTLWNIDIIATSIINNNYQKQQKRNICNQMNIKRDIIKKKEGRKYALFK